MIHLDLDLARDGSALVGSVGVTGGPLRPFIGWIGLNGAIEELLDEAAEMSAAEPEGRASSDGLGGHEGP